MKDPLLPATVYLAVGVICIFGLIIFAGFKAGHLKAVPEPPKFQIVDKYGKCDVVQYNHTGDAKFHYFLDCSK